MAVLVRLCLIVFFGILMNYNGTEAQISADFVSIVPTINNYIGKTGALFETYTKLKTQCAQKCSHVENCRSFFYNAAQKFCQLQDVVFVNYYPLTHFYQTKYYKMKEVLSNFTCPPSPPDAFYNTVLLFDNTVFTYRIVWSTVSKATAETACAAEGAWLVRVLTPAKMQTLVNLFSSCQGFVATSVDYWIDGYNAVDPFDITQWTTSVGNPLPTSNWAPGEPKGQNNYNCVALLAAEGYQWSNFACSLTKYYICEK